MRLDIRTLSYHLPLECQPVKAGGRALGTIEIMLLKMLPETNTLWEVAMMLCAGLRELFWNNFKKFDRRWYCKNNGELAI